MYKSDSKKVTVLLVEDDAVDVETVRRGFTKLGLENPIRVASNGVQALSVLRGDRETPRIEPPYIVILDINMPRMNGIEFLEELRADPILNQTLVLVLTTSDRIEDRANAQRLGAIDFVNKRDAAKNFSRIARVIEQYWRITC